MEPTLNTLFQKQLSQVRLNAKKYKCSREVNKNNLLDGHLAMWLFIVCVIMIYLFMQSVNCMMTQAGHRKFFLLSGSNFQNVKIFCEIQHFSNLPRSPERMGWWRNQTPCGGPGGGVFWGPISISHFFYYYYSFFFLSSVIFFWERECHAPMEFEALDLGFTLDD